MKTSTAAVLAIALLVGAYAFYVSPRITESRAGFREQLESSALTLKKYEMFVEDKTLAGEELKKATAELARLEKGMTSAKDEPLAAAKLQSRLQDVAENAGVSVMSIRPGPPIKLKGYTAFPLEIEGSGNTASLSAMLKSLDSNPEFILIDRLDVMQAGLAETGLRIKLQVRGLAKI